MPTNQPPSPSLGRRAPARGRLAGAVLATATALGLLFGLTAPSVSPVTPTLPGVLAVNAVVGQDEPAAPVVVSDAPGRDGRGRR